MRNYLIGILHSQNGIQRDGTEYFSKAYVDGQWVRFYENVPKKIGGCTATALGDADIVRSLYVVPQTTGINLYMGRAPVRGGVAYAPGNVQYIPITTGGIAGAPVDRTPVADFTPDIDYVWDFDAGSFTYMGPDQPLLGPANIICAHVAIDDVSSTANGGVYVGVINDNVGNPATTPLFPVFDKDGNQITCSGGILYCAPVLIAYGNDGIITWSPVNGSFVSGTNPGTWDRTLETGNLLTIANSKIVKGANTRGSGSPTVLFWSLTSLIRATLTIVGTGTTPTFISTVIQDNISIISANSVVNYEQQFFWIGTDQFYVYNGIVQTLPNTMNNEWFFQGINTTYRSKVWGVAVPRYKEIWWFYPSGTASECDACIIYNVELNVWYDNTIAADSVFNVYPFTRAAGVSATGNYPFPIYSDNTLVSNPLNPSSMTYPIWTHEIGVDRVIGIESYAINSYFRTHLMDLWTNDGANSNLLNNWRVAPDFVMPMGSQMSLTVYRQMYPNDTATIDGPYPFTNSIPFIDLSSQGGLCSFQFTSNVVGGNYQAGKILYFYNKGDTLK